MVTELREMRTLYMNEKDNIAIALSEIAENTTVHLCIREVQKHVHVMEKILFGHKFAVKDIAAGEDILKYGEVIGIATKDIKAGEHVHVHNIKSKRGSAV